MSINLTQRFDYETDSLVSFEKVLDTMVRVMYKEKPELYSQMFMTFRNIDGNFDTGKRFVGAGKGVEGLDFTQPKYMHICTIGDYKELIKKEDAKFDTYDGLVFAAMHHVKSADADSFLKQCGDGFNSFFSYSDGSIEPG